MVLVAVLETCRVVAVALLPVMPALCTRVMLQLGYSLDQVQVGVP